MLAAPFPSLAGIFQQDRCQKRDGFFMSIPSAISIVRRRWWWCEIVRLKGVDVWFKPITKNLLVICPWVGVSTFIFGPDFHIHLAHKNSPIQHLGKVFALLRIKYLLYDISAILEKLPVHVGRLMMEHAHFIFEYRAIKVTIKSDSNAHSLYS